MLDEGAITWYQFAAVPAIVSLILKLSILWLAWRSVNHDYRWFGLITFFAIQNLIEILLLTGVVGVGHTPDLLRAYYVCAIVLVLYALDYVRDTNSNAQKTWLVLSCAIGFVIVIALSFSNHLIYGFEPFYYSVASIKGEYHWIFRVFMLAMLVSIIAFLVISARYWSTRDPRMESKFVYFGKALACLLVATFLSIVFPMMGIPFNSLAIIPIASTVFLVITLRGRETAKLKRDFRASLPSTLENAVQKEMDMANALLWNNHIGYRDWLRRVEIAQVRYKYLKHKTITQRVAKSMRIPLSSLYHLMRRLKISQNNDVEPNDNF